MRKVFVIIAIMLITGSASLAQPEPGHLGPKAQLRERISMIRMWKLVEFLELSEEQSMLFFPAMNEHESQMKTLHESEMRILDRIEAMLDEKQVNRIALESAIDSVETIRMQRAQSMTDFTNKTQNILNIEQRAKFLLFDRVFEKEIRAIIDMGKPGGDQPPGRPPKKPK